MTKSAHRRQVDSGRKMAYHNLPAVGTVVAPTVTAVAALLIPGTVGDAVSALSAGADPTSAVITLTAVIAAAITGNVLDTAATGAYVARRTAALRATVARSAVGSSGTLGTADLVTRLLVDARQPAVKLPILTAVVLAAASAVAGLVLLATVDWTLLVGVVIGLLAVLVLVRNLVGDLSPLVQRYRSRQGDLGQRLLDAQSGAVAIRSAGTWRREVTRVLDALPPVRAAGEELWAAQRQFAWKTSLFVPAVLLVTIGVGGWSLSNGRIDVGGFAAAIGYVLVILGALDGIEAAAGLGSVRAGEARLAQLPRSERSDLEAAPARPPGPLSVVLDDVTVRSADGRELLTAVDLDIAPGAFVAITGAAGSGRSTLARVIAGITAPAAGQVLIGGRTPDEWPADGGGRPTVYGQNRPAMLNGTIGGAIGLAATPGRHSVRDAATQAHLIDVIDALPDGFDTDLTQVELSGGELQRLAIAQALSRPSGLLVLDDVTASLDPATEREVLGALLAARHDRTLVVVTNREAVLERADVIVDIVGGSVAVLAGARRHS